MNETEKWIYAPSATFEGTKATLFEKKVSMENRSAAFFKTPSHLPTNNVYDVTFKEMIFQKGMKIFVLATQWNQNTLQFTKLLIQVKVRTL